VRVIIRGGRERERNEGKRARERGGGVARERTKREREREKNIDEFFSVSFPVLFSLPLSLSDLLCLLVRRCFARAPVLLASFLYLHVLLLLV